MSGEIVRTTGRRMSQMLQDALDGVQNRERVIRAFSMVADADGSELALLYRAMALELRLVGLREQATLTQMAQSLQAMDGDGPPYPPATGKALVYDYKTDSFVEIADPEAGRDSPNDPKPGPSC